MCSISDLDDSDGNYCICYKIKKRNSTAHSKQVWCKIHWIHWLIIMLIGVTIMIVLFGALVFYVRGKDNLSDVGQQTEQILLPPTNQTSECFFGPCIIITYNYGITIDNYDIITHSPSAQCSPEALQCINAVYKNLPAPQIIYYNINNPNGTFTTSNAMLVNANVQIFAGWVFIGWGLFMIPFSGIMWAIKYIINKKYKKNNIQA